MRLTFLAALLLAAPVVISCEGQVSDPAESAGSIGSRTPSAGAQSPQPAAAGTAGAAAAPASSPPPASDRAVPASTTTTTSDPTAVVPPATSPTAVTPPPVTPPPSQPTQPTSPTTTATTATPSPGPAAAGSIVPLYTDPSDPSWQNIVAAKKAHPRVRVVAIVNPSNGPGAAPSTGYTTGIGRLADAGIVVIGYVATGYASRVDTAVRADIDRWKQFYPSLGGIFFDEQSNKAGQEDYYRRLSQYAKGQGLAFTVGNPGTDTAESYIGVLDTMLIYESKGVSPTTALTGWHTKYAATNFGVIPYGTALNVDYIRTARAHVGYVYLNNDDLPNPWDSLPSYFPELLAALE